MANIQKTTSAPAIRSGDPFAAFRSYADTLFDDMFHSNISTFFRREAPVTRRARETFLVPSVDVHEAEKEITVTAELPGMDEDDVELTLNDGVLTIKGEKKYERKGEEDARVIERSYGSFQRSFSLPESVDEEAIAASFDKGVLSVIMPKREEETRKPRRISIG